MSRDFDEASRQLESEWREKTETLETQILAKELRERQLDNEVSLLRANLEAFEKEKERKKETEEKWKEEKENEGEELKSRIVVQQSRVKVYMCLVC